MLYPLAAIEKATEWADQKESAKEWLEGNNFPELVQLCLAARRYPKAFEYLLVNKHFVLATFVNAIWEDKKAFALLMEKKEFVWAAMANFINGDDNALQFLNKNKLKHYSQFAIKLQARIRKDGDENSSFFNSGPYKI
jgi:hypothetical protein